MSAPRTLAVFAVLAGAAWAAEVALVNASFEAVGELPQGWTLGQGARSGTGPESSVALERTAPAADGNASLRLSGNVDTGTWRVVEQSVPVHAGDRVTLRVRGRSAGVVREASQYANANATLSFDDAEGSRLSIVATPMLAGDHPWTELVSDVIAPPGTARVRVGLFLSMSGTVWFDDVRVDVAPATAADPEGRARAFDALARHLARTYPFFGVGGKPAAADLFARHRDAAVAAEGEAAFVEALRAMLGELDDLHVTIETREGRLPTAKPAAPAPNWNLSTIHGALSETVAKEQYLLAGRMGKGADAIGYLLLASLQLGDEQMARVEKALDELEGARALILDLRPNPGGDERVAMKIAGRFTDKPVVYARSVFRDPLESATGAFLPAMDRTLAPAGAFDGRRVVVLQGPHCVSSTEGMLLMLRALPNVTTIGLPSRGASGNPAPFEVVPGVKVWSSRWRSLTPDGTLVEGRGVPPEILVEGSHRSGDPTLERALTELR